MRVISIRHRPIPTGQRQNRLTALLAVLAIATALQACGSVEPAVAPGAARQQLDNPRTASASAYRRAPVGTQYHIVGVASWYGKPYHGRRTASGEVYNMYQMTAAHPSLPFGTRVAVTNLDNGRTVVLKINDRGPFVGDRVIDVSRKAAGKLGFLGQGLTRVGVRVVAPKQG